MTDIAFDQIPGSIRTPGVYTEFNTATAVRTLAGNPQKVVLLGQRLSTGTYKGTDPVQVFSDEQAATLFGRGSQAHLMVKAAITAYQYLQLFVLPLSDNSVGGIAATSTVTLTGNATGAGQNSVWIAGTRIDVAAANADIPTAMAAKLISAINANKNLPVTAAAAAGVVTLTARNKGTFGNEFGIRVASTVPGVTVATAAGTDGAGDPDVSTALAIIYGSGFNVVINPYSTDDSLTALRTFLESVSGPLVQRGAVGVAGWRSTLATATTLAGELNEGRITLAWHNGSQLPNAFIAAGYGAVLASQDDPARPYDGLPITGLDVTALGSQPGGTEIESALWNGVTPLKIGPGNQVQIVRAISTYTTSADGAADPSLLDITSIRSLDYVRLAIDNRIELRFPRQKNTPRVALAVRSEILNVLYQLEDMEIVENVDQYKAGVIVQNSEQDSGRLNCAIPTNVVSGLHVIASRIDMIL
ncbi:phage tail sheath subtilisin-like domain-containing protein [Serratia fonticola]|uniref:phage tail sheath subtilisin-like domain-containing protein n=1 Tax=Serratia fonticola TaxID=47917 RepID=UPI001646A5EB|nr:phage tail sheath subtilisin-like domain-containing protein [Serratia fonticola]MBC3252860.1 phage tail sheath subtilisin-like domain-containing protein [Serratia fonticola]